MAMLQMWIWAVVAIMGVQGSVGVEVLVGGGAVKGTTLKSRDGRDYHAFKAIPYAQPPIGDKRFMPTVPGAEWEGVRDATKDGEPCAQAALGIVAGVEDCLNLYVYTPKMPAEGQNISMPVVVWLHSGSFVVGGAANIDPSFVMDRDLVLVVPQYRLGFLGFFSSSSGHSSGNAGMLDQVEALRWVRDNIRAFGGDPDQVTLAGDCGGGAAALYHMMSPLSKGLFHRVMSLSGSPLNPWALLTRHHRFLLILANHVKCPAYDPALLVQCFQEVEKDELLDGVQMLLEARDPVVGNHRLSPVVQQPAHAHETTLFLSQHPLKALMQGDFHKVPVLLGITRDVGGYLVDMLLYDFIQYKLEGEPDFLEKLLKMLLRESDIRDASDREEEFAEFYFPGNAFTELDSLLPGLAQMLGDIQYRAGVLSAATLLSQHVPTRVLRFEYEGGPKLFSLRYPDPAEAPPMPPAVGHGDETTLLLPDQKFDLTPEQREVSNAMVDMLSDFAYGRIPKEGWPLFTSDGLETLLWGPEGSTIAPAPFAPEARVDMLRRIHSYHHQKTMDEVNQESESAHDEL
ncbi:cocaine esterase isoform X1 [Penaeus vannamei]|uniref:cocaine esterase isoform X1 n=2 Tax=Penaeus vannamei TaxID=6689 RepID=UPI00387F38F3